MAAVEARLAAVPGLAAAAAPMLLAAVELVLLRVNNGAAQPLRVKMDKVETEKAIALCIKSLVLLCATRNIKYSGSPRSIRNGIKNTIRSFLINNYFAFTAVSGEHLEFDWSIFS